MTAVIEGDVLGPRRIERNAARTPEVLPPDVDTKVVAISRLESPELQARAVTTMLNHARTGLLAAIASQELPQIAEYKRKARAIEDIAKQVRLGKDIQLDAAEFCRRAERGLGVAIREGQESGVVARRGQHKTADCSISPTDVATNSELFGDKRGPDANGIYAMTDNVSDDQFDEVLTEAKSEGNLSRANVARKCKAKSAPLIDESDPEIDADVQPKPSAMPPRNKPEPGPRPFKKSDAEMLAEIVGSLANFADLMRYIQPNNINKDDAIRLADQASSAIGLIRKSFKEIRNGKA